jgi:hypothetical protein
VDAEANDSKAENQAETKEHKAKDTFNRHRTETKEDAKANHSKAKTREHVANDSEADRHRTEAKVDAEANDSKAKNQAEAKEHEA